MSGLILPEAGNEFSFPEWSLDDLGKIRVNTVYQTSGHTGTDITIQENLSAEETIKKIVDFHEKQQRYEDHGPALLEDARRTVAQQDGVNRVLVDGAL